MMSFKIFMLGESPLMSLIRDNPDSLKFGTELIKAQRKGTIKISKKWPGAGTREALKKHNKYYKRKEKAALDEVDKYYDHDKEEEEKRFAPGLEFKAIERALVPVKFDKKQLEKLKSKYKGKVVQPSLTVGPKSFGSKEPIPIRKGDVAKHTLSATEKERKYAKIGAHEKLYGDSPRKEREQKGQTRLFSKN